MFFKKSLSLFVVGCIFVSSTLLSSEFSVASYNCGGLSDHYDYIRAVCMQKLVQERYNKEPKTMAQLEKIQNLALKILFSDDELERSTAEKIWIQNNYTQIFEKITKHPDSQESINKIWREKSKQIVTPYDIRPVIIHDVEVDKILSDHITDLTRGQNIELDPSAPLNDWLDLTRHVMAKRIFHHQLKYDIICLQEADYLDSSVFPENYDVEFSNTEHSINGIAWNKKRFDLVQIIGDVIGQGFVVKLRDIESGTTVLIASGHLKGCNPFTPVMDNETGKLDSFKGDQGLQSIINTLSTCESDIKIIGMDSNVTATHPRLSQLKDSSYVIDYENYLEPTCSNPWQVLNTRIDWIAVNSKESGIKITNLPILGVNLNSTQTNISDHKPIAVKIQRQEILP